MKNIIEQTLGTTRHKNLYFKGYTPNDILLTFMKYLFEYENNLKKAFISK